MLQENMKDKELRIHPTQKPVKLYEWLLANYAKKGDKILDTHVGSASSLIACHNLGFEYMGFELDPDYFKAATERLDAVKAQMRLYWKDELKWHGLKSTSGIWCWKNTQGLIYALVQTARNTAKGIVAIRFALRKPSNI